MREEGKKINILYKYKSSNTQATTTTAAATTATTTIAPTSGIIIEVNHLSFTRTLYFQLSRKLHRERKREIST